MFLHIGLVRNRGTDTIISCKSDFKRKKVYGFFDNSNILYFKKEINPDHACFYILSGEGLDTRLMCWCECPGLAVPSNVNCSDIVVGYGG